MIEPVAPDERIATLDALRGAALYGVLLVNLVQAFRISLFAYLTRFHTDSAALDHYLTQSLVGIAIFYAIGLGAMNRLGSAAGAALATAIFALQTWLSTSWLRRHRFGPIEWLWRRLAYGATRAAR